MIKGTSKNIVCDKPGCNTILNNKPHTCRKGKQGQMLHYCPGHDPKEYHPKDIVVSKPKIPNA